MSGYILAHRSAYKHPAFNNPIEAGVWLYMVALASWQPTRVRFKGRTIDLERGQLAISLRTFSEELGWSKSKLCHFIERLKNETMIETDSETGITVITICNYDKYQCQDDASETADTTVSETVVGQQQDSNRTQNNKGKEYIPPLSPKGDIPPSNNPEFPDSSACKESLPIAQQSEVPLGKPKLRRGVRVPDNWEPEAADKAYAEQLGIDSAWEAEKFRNYYTNGRGKNETFVDIHRAWQSWIRNAVEWRKPGGGQPAGIAGTTHAPPASASARRGMRYTSGMDLSGDRAGVIEAQAVDLTGADHASHD